MAVKEIRILLKKKVNCFVSSENIYIYVIYLYIQITRSNHKPFHDVECDNDVFSSKHVAVKFTHSSMDCQSANCQLKAVIYTVRCGQQSMPLQIA